MLHTIKTTQLLKTDLKTVWNFISSPKNLSEITPAYMNFNIITDDADINTMYAGQIIEYYVTPISGIKMHWVTEITHVEPLHYFVDEQRFGPYKLWHHKHFIKEVEGGIEMTDIVHYKIPYGFIGSILNKLFIKKRLTEIFVYRHIKLEELFNNQK